MLVIINGFVSVPAPPSKFGWAKDNEENIRKRKKKNKVFIEWFSEKKRLFAIAMTSSGIFFATASIVSVVMILMY